MKRIFERLKREKQRKEADKVILASERGPSYLDERETEWLNYILGNIVSHYGRPREDGAPPKIYKDSYVYIDLGSVPGTAIEVRYFMNDRWYPVYRSDEKCKHYKGAWFQYIDNLYMKIIWEKE